MEAFNRHKDGHQWWCRECFKQYFRERGQKHIQQVNASRDARRVRAHEFVLAHLRTHPCVDCGETDVVVLEFDHVGIKATEVGRLVGSSTRVDRIEVEIANCQVVCCNCHRRRTYLRRGASRTPESASSIKNWKVRRNVQWMYEYLERSSCATCGLTDPLVLEFDHISNKRRNVTQMAWTEYGMAALEAEVSKCVVLCANCHRRKTSADRNTFRHRASMTVAIPGKLI